MMEFLSMGGHAPYVWGSYGVALLLIIAEIIFLRYRRKKVRQRLQRMARLLEHEKNEC